MPRLGLSAHVVLEAAESAEPPLSVRVAACSEKATDKSPQVEPVVLSPLAVSRVAASEDFVAYALPGGHIRVQSLKTGSRAFFSGSSGVASLLFSPWKPNILAAAYADGRVVVRLLTQACRSVSTRRAASLRSRMTARRERGRDVPSLSRGAALASSAGASTLTPASSQAASWRSWLGAPTFCTWASRSAHASRLFLSPR